MPTRCACGNTTREDRPVGWVLIERPCRCKDPGRPTVESLRAPPVDLHQPSDPKRRRLGLPGLTDLERAVLPPEQRNRYE
jgi:hypothetical protein